MTLTVDAHHHFWDPARATYPFLTDDLAGIRRAFGSTDLAPALAARRVDRTILVQTRSSLTETREFLAIAERVPFIGGVIGWVDLTDPAVDDTIAELRTGPGGRWLVGIRHQVEDERDPRWLLRPDVRHGLAAVAAADLPYDLLIRPGHLAVATTVAEALPDLRFVVDHLAKPPIASRETEPWARAIAPLAALPNVAAKLSGMVTEADHGGWLPADLQPYVDRMLELFGPDRLMFGSDWPVCLLAATYEQVFDATEASLAQLGLAERRAVFGGTATRVYRLAG